MKTIAAKSTGSGFFFAFLGVDLGSDGPNARHAVVGATKIICDYIDSLRGLGALLGN